MITQTTETFAEIGTPTNPFPGLRPFEFAESHLFFGRDGQSEQLISKLGRTRFLAVVGSSGSGKSSLVRAGLLPSLMGGFMTSAGSDWRIAIMRPGNDPVGNLARSLNAPEVFGSEIEENASLQTAITEATLRRGSLGLVDAVRQGAMPEHENLLVLVDQFEEIFRFARVSKTEEYQNEAAAFVKLVLEACRQREIPIYVVLTMRSDYLGDCSQFWDLPEAVNESQYLIPRLTRDRLREAITGPVAVGGGDITPRLVNRLLNDVGDDQDQLPILQHALMRTWDKWKEDHHDDQPIDIGCYEEIGTMLNALSDHADEAYAELTDERSKEIAEKFFKGLTEKGPDNREVRRPIELKELCTLGEASEAEVVAVLEVFRKEGRSFLMPPVRVPLTGASLIDISHESLIRNWKRLKEWVEQESRSARVYKRLAETAVLHREGAEALLIDPALQVALDWRQTNRPNAVWARRYHPEFATALTFLDASVAARDAEVQERERRRRAEVSYKRTKLVALLLALSFLLSLGSAAYAIQQSREAKRQREIAEMQRNRAEEQRGIAEMQTDIARDESLEAKAQKAEAVRQGNIAIERSNDAEKNRKAALGEKHKAQLAEAEAVQQRYIAEQQRYLAEKQAAAAKDAESLAREAQAFARRAEEQSLHLLYAADLNLAQSEYTTGKFERANGLLERFYQPLVEQPADSPRGTKDEQPKDLRGFEWYYLWRAFHTKKPSLILHKDTVTAVAYSPDGNILATGGADKTVKLWTTDSQREIGSMENLSAAVVALTFSPDGKILAYDDGKNVRLIETDTQRPVATLNAGNGTVRSLAFSPDGKTLAVGRDRDIELWDAGTRQQLATLKGHPDYIISVAYSPDGQVLATGSADKTVKLWDIARYQEIASLTQPEGVTSLAFSPNGKRLAIGSDNNTVLLDSSSHQILAKLQGDGTITSLTFSPDGKTLATGSYTTVSLWDVASGRELATSQTGAVTSLSFSTDGTTLAIGGGDNTVKLLDLASPPALSTATTDQIKSLAFSPDGKTLAMGSFNGIKLLDIQRGIDFTLMADSSSVHALAFSADGKLLAAGTESNGLKVWDMGTHKELTESTGETDVTRAGGAIRSVTFSPDGKVLVEGRIDGAVTLLDTRTLHLIRQLRTDDAAMSLAFSADGKLLAAGDHRGHLRVWETDSYERFTIRKGTAGFRAVAFSPDGRTVAGSGDDKTVCVWDLNLSTDKLVKLEGHTDRVMSLAFSPDGRTLATGSIDHTVKLWDTHSYQELTTLKGAGEALTFSPDGKTLAVAAAYQIYFWHAATKDEVVAREKKAGSVQ